MKLSCLTYDWVERVFINNSEDQIFQKISNTTKQAKKKNNVQGKHCFQKNNKLIIFNYCKRHRNLYIFCVYIIPICIIIKLDKLMMEKNLIGKIDKNKSQDNDFGYLIQKKNQISEKEETISLIDESQHQQNKEYYFFKNIRKCIFAMIILFLCLAFLGNEESFQSFTYKKQSLNSLNMEKNMNIFSNQENSDGSLQDFKSILLAQTLAQQKYYDMQFFFKQLYQNQYKILKYATKELQIISKKRPIINLSSQLQYLNLIAQNKQVNKFQISEQMIILSNQTENKSLAEFYYSLSMNPNKKKFLQAEFYHLDKLYHIGQYGSQLPLCIVVVGKDNVKGIEKSYDSIKRQNYTNYRVVHVDDSSRDSSLKKISVYLEKNQELKNKVTVISNNYQRNTLYSRHLGVSKYCQSGQIIIDLDLGDNFIGNQLFQLINTIYTQGKVTNDYKHDIWLAYIQSIGQINSCCPSIRSKNRQSQFEQIRSKNKEIKHLRTYLWDLYAKIDIEQFREYLIPNKKQFYVERSDAFIHYPMIQMAGIDHILLLPQFGYFESSIENMQTNLQKQYAYQILQHIIPYTKLQNLSEQPKRIVHKNKQQEILVNKKSSEMQLKITNLKNIVLEEYKKQKQKKSKSKIEIVKVYNKNNYNKIFGQSEQFQTDVSQIVFQNIIPGFKYKLHSFQTRIQVGSIYDYMNLGKIINMTQLKHKLSDSLAHEVYSFIYNQKLEKESKKLEYKYFNNSVQIEKYIKNAITYTPQGAPIEDDFEYHLGSGLSCKQKTQKYLQLQYYYSNKKYKIQQSNQQTSFCIYSSGYNIQSKAKYQNYFKSLQILNYTNFHIIYVDDNSNDSSAEKIYQYLQGTNYRIKNRIKIVKNLQHIGILCNMHIHILKYCKPQDVVIITDADDSIIGLQTLHILNSKYKDPDAWVVYSRFLMNSQKSDFFYKSQSSYPMTVNLQEYRTMMGYWVTSHLRTFRWKVFNKVPLQHFIQFNYDQARKVVTPAYYETSADRCQVYSNLQISGKNRIHFLTDFFYLYETSPQKECHVKRQLYQQDKCRLKYSIKSIKEQNQQIKYYNNQEIHKQILNHLQWSYDQYINCKE